MNKGKCLPKSHLFLTEDQGNKNVGITVSSSSMDSNRCLGCGTVGSGHSVYTRLQGEHRQQSALHKLASILNQDLLDLQNYSDIICQNCLNRLEDVEKLEHQLIHLCQDTIQDFHKTIKNLSKSGSITVMDAENDQCLLVLKDINFQVSGESYVKRVLSNAKCKKKMMKKENSKILKKHECSVCSAKFRAYSHKVEHMVTHLDEKPFSCNICTYSAKSKSNLNKHKLTHNRKVIMCSLCFSEFDNKIDLREHMEEHKNETSIICNVCNKSFLKRKDYRVHMKLHDTQSKKFDCDECDKIFVLSSRLKRHKLIHVKDKSFECTTCNKKFSRVDDLKNHKRTHTGERPYKCTQCEKGFKFKSNYCAHKKICKITGNNNTNYECKPCNISFLNENKLKNHLKSKSHQKGILVKPQDLPSSFQCDQCNGIILLNDRDNHSKICFQNKEISLNDKFIIRDISEMHCLPDNSMQHYLNIDTNIGIQTNNNGLMISTFNGNKNFENIKPIERLSDPENEINIIATLDGSECENFIPMFHRDSSGANNVLSNTDSNIRTVIGAQNNSPFILSTISNDVPNNSNSLRVLHSSQIDQSSLLGSFSRNDVPHLD